ncbi:MAG: SGNH/GDSL hydrolase family protein, partial [Clostridia bacterium]|nr:SGNH/GDSL hydrolase family protein [Clostridia bacterium]
MLWGVPSDITLNDINYSAVRDCKSYSALKSKLIAPKPMTWLFLGDSITHGCVHTHGRRSYGEYFAYHMRNALGRRDDIFINCAVSGATTLQGKPCDLLWLERYVPDVAFICYGMNDCATHNNISPDKFYDSLNGIVNSVLSVGAIPILQVAQPSRDDSRHTAPHFDMIRRIAKEREVMLIDHTAVWNEKGAYRKYLDDAIHPNAYGHLLMARTVIHALGLACDGGVNAMPNRSIKGRVKYDDRLKQQLMKNPYARQLIEGDRHMRILCVGFADGEAAVRDEVQALEEELRYFVHNKKFESMARHLIKVNKASLKRAIAMFTPHIIIEKAGKEIKVSRNTAL